MKGLRGRGGPNARDPLFLSAGSGPGTPGGPQRGLHPGLALSLRRVPVLSARTLPPPPSPLSQSFLPQGALVYGAPCFFTGGSQDATPWHRAPILGRFLQEAPRFLPALQASASAQTPNGDSPRTSVPTPVPRPPLAQAPSSGLRSPAGPRGSGHLPFPGLCWTLPSPPSLALPGC